MKPCYRTQKTCNLDTFVTKLKNLEMISKNIKYFHLESSLFGFGDDSPHGMLPGLVFQVHFAVFLYFDS